MGPPGANFLRRFRPGDARRGELDQRLGQRQSDLIGGDALPCLSSTTTDRRQRFAAPGSLFHTGIMTLQPSALLASTGGVRLRAWVSPCQCSALMPCRLWICSFNCTVSRTADPRAAWPDRLSDFALTILHHRQIIPLRTIEAAPAQRIADRYLVCGQLLLKGDAKAIV